MNYVAHAVGLAVVLTWALPSFGGIADSPLPALVAGKTTVHVYSVPGIRGGAGGLGAFFSCTSNGHCDDEGGRRVSVITSFPPF